MELENSGEFVHQRHKPLQNLPEGADLIVAVPQLRSNINLSRIARAAGCSGVKKILVEGNVKIDPKIARDAADSIEFEKRNSLLPSLRKLKSAGYHLAGLEQTTNSTLIFEHSFPLKTVLVIGHERHGIKPDVLGQLDATVEIPVYGLPYSFNVATATAMAIYEYCRQLRMPS